MVRHLPAYVLHVVKGNILVEQVQHYIGPPMEIARGFVIQSTIEYRSFLKARNWIQNFQNILFHNQFLQMKRLF